MTAIRSKLAAITIAMGALPVGTAFACAGPAMYTPPSDDDIILQQIFGDEDRNAPYDTHNYPPAE